MTAIHVMADEGELQCMQIVSSIMHWHHVPSAAPADLSCGCWICLWELLKAMPFQGLNRACWLVWSQAVLTFSPGRARGTLLRWR